ncbi:uncharacterized protein LOC122859920 [Aphidius gifuensis]|uniref:uncharacterized protein LOC122859920 n=1 Tax=Aphidius gifuensis TaxID=684658 RepID=UPI001CDB79D0|nr:uncharacterized protein LOC122859920 [Aphidius gifuensis]
MTSATPKELEISALKNHGQLPKSSSLIRLTPYLDKEGVLRVGIYWKCVICTRQRALVSQQLMGQLPPARCNPNPAFINTGVDFAGPFILKKWLGRCKQTYKAYIAVFVCFATSATHLEVVNGLSTEEFIAAYRRFTSLRGECKNLYSDCGTNFIGTIKEHQLLNTQAHNMCDFAHQVSLESTNWHLNPPGAPHQDGKWEAGVKSMKHYLSRIMGATPYTYHQLDTLVKQISAQLNSRPLCPMTNDPNDLEALTPGHFLISRAMTAIPEG